MTRRALHWLPWRESFAAETGDQVFQVIRSENRLARLEQRRFADLGLREREHLQEWLAHTPEALGEELLVIQKEFDGFADTRERLDLLAIDREGRLVGIENRLDDWGRDVVWADAEVRLEQTFSDPLARLNRQIKFGVDR